MEGHQSVVRITFFISEQSITLIGMRTKTFGPIKLKAIAFDQCNMKNWVLTSMMRDVDFFKSIPIEKSKM